MTIAQQTLCGSKSYELLTGHGITATVRYQMDKRLTENKTKEHKAQ